jgi:signal transduction histidine kinase
MRLAAFIRASIKPITSEWESFARTLTPAADGMSPLALRDHIKEILAFIADDIESAQTKVEQEEKSHGEKRPEPIASAAETHAALRHAGGFNMDQMVSEYRALRASVIKLWRAQLGTATDLDIADSTRFHEAIDQALTESISDYSKRLDHSRSLFLGILSHDLRNPLGASRMSAELVLKSKASNLDEREKMLIGQVVECADRATEIVDHLLDLTRTRLGSGIPVIKEPMDMAYVANQLIDEMRAVHPKCIFNLKVTGDTKGDWDKPRIGQVFSNLLNNAVQYGFSESPISVTVEGQKDEVILSVQNSGVPIPREVIGRIFESLLRGKPEASDDSPESVNLGLGLYIVKEIMNAHGGTIDVTSSEADGTTFTAHFPRSS